MNLYSLFNQTIVYLREAIRIQLILFLWALPILVSWGLPVSYMIIVGNIVCGPLIALFLACSAVYFVLLLIGFSGAWWSVLLEYIVRLWMWVLSWGSPRWLFALPQPPWWILLLIPLSVVYIMYAVKPYIKPWQELGILMVAALGWMTILRYFQAQSVSIVYQGKNQLYIVPDQPPLLCDMHGVLRGGSSVQKWAHFHVKALLAQKYGACGCQRLFLARPSQRRLSAGAELIASGIVQEIIIPERIYQQSWCALWRSCHEEIVVRPITMREEKVLQQVIFDQIGQDQRSFDKAKEAWDNETKSYISSGNTGEI